jgi:FHA domain
MCSSIKPSFPRTLHRNAKALFGLCLGLMSGGVGSFRRSSLRVRMGLKVTMARLILNCEGVGLVMRELGRDIVMIGRAPSNQIVIDHPTVSEQHAVLLKTGDSYSLKDLDSTNGTQINGYFVTDAELKDGDRIRFGSVIAVFAGAYRKPCSSHGIRKFWMSISGKGAQPIAFAMASASLNLV